MAKFDFKCTSCEYVQEEILKISERDSAKIACTKCGKPSKYKFTPTNFYMHFRGDGWPSKTIREKSYRKQRNEVMSRRQADHVAKPELQPNFNGMKTGSWSDAQAMAHDAGKNAETYTPLIQKERAGKVKPKTMKKVG